MSLLATRLESSHVVYKKVLLLTNLTAQCVVSSESPAPGIVRPAPARLCSSRLELYGRAPLPPESRDEPVIK